MENTLTFIKIYAIIVMVILIVQPINDVPIIPVNFPSFDTNKMNILDYIGLFIGLAVTVVEFLFQIIVFSFPNMTIVNLFLWSYRVICIIELIPYIKKVIHPTTA